MANYVHIPSYGSNKSGRINHETVKVGDITFDSISEKDRYLELIIMERAGTISNLRCHPEYELIPTQRIPGKPTLRRHRYTADFEYVRDGELIIEDVKSEYTRQERDYIINRKLMLMLKGLYVTEVVR